MVERVERFGDGLEVKALADWEGTAETGVEVKLLKPTAALRPIMVPGSALAQVLTALGVSTKPGRQGRRPVVWMLFCPVATLNGSGE